MEGPNQTPCQRNPGLVPRALRIRSLMRCHCVRSAAKLQISMLQNITHYLILVKATHFIKLWQI